MRDGSFLPASGPDRGDSAPVRASKSVGWHTYSDGALTARNTKAPVYTPELSEPGTSVAAYGWAPTSVAEPSEDRVEADLDLFLPTLRGAPRDVVDVNSVQYEVVGDPEDYNHGPFGSSFGCVVKLKRTQR